jgi:hypothetical protein
MPTGSAARDEFSGGALDIIDLRGEGDTGEF